MDYGMTFFCENLWFLFFIFSCQLKEACPFNEPNPSGLARDVWEIDQSDLKLMDRLGKGMFGEVWKGFWNNRVEVAVKQMRPGSMDPEAFRQEAEVMKTLRHPRLVSLYGVCYRNVFIVSLRVCAWRHLI